MTQRIGRVVIVENEPDKRCSRCGEKKDCRDVLGDGKQVCFHCASEKEQNDYCARLFGDKTAN
jgi:formylmethanofuran dehydrogenase subunit E